MSARLWLRLDGLLTRLRRHRYALSLLTDAAVVALTWQFTYLFRLGFERWLSARPAYDGLVLAGAVALYLLVFVLLGVPRGIWRFSGFGEVKRLAMACTIAGALTASIVLGAQLREVPRAVLALHPVIALFGLAGVRIAYRMLYEQLRAQLSGRDAHTRTALVLGAGDAARLLAAGLQHQGWRLVGLLDDDAAKRGARLAGLPVLGAIADVADLARHHDVSHLIVAMPSVTAAQRRRVIAAASATGLPVLTVPSAQELLDGATVSRVRDIQPEDLLGREPVQLDEAGIADCISGKTVLITGAGGSIGSELCRQVARYGPSRLVFFELSEFNLYTIEQELGERFPSLPRVCLVGDVRDLTHLRAAVAKWRPQVVFHAAAYKHVPLMEDSDNAWQCLRNNVIGTYHAAVAAAEQRVERFVLISTDKAVNPTNVMGATKRVAEMVISALAGEHPDTRFMAVRFGNVLGSSGSVIPKFKAQIARGGPVTVTHPDVIRYFMTIPEAARLVLQAAAIGDSGQVLVLDMGEPVRIVDLARQMIRLSGRSEDEVRIVFSGLRPGEKLYEELLAVSDGTVPTVSPALRVAQLRNDDAAVRSLIAEALARSGALDVPASEVRALLARAVPEYAAAPR